MSRTPKIAVSFDFHETEFGFFLKKPYYYSLKNQGATVIPLLYDVDQIDGVLDSCDGLMMPGGLIDLDPKTYKQPKLYDTVKINSLRTEFDFVLLEKALAKDIPILAICWSFQALNVFLGGSLIQDIPKQRPSDLVHEQKEPATTPTHWVDFIEKGKARDIFGAERLKVNSTHHQGLDELGKGLVIEGKATDGLVECFRLDGKDFVWGVQWHPERLDDDPIISAFLKACQH